MLRPFDIINQIAPALDPSIQKPGKSSRIQVHQLMSLEELSVNIPMGQYTLI